MSFIAMLLAGVFCGFVDSCLGMGYGVTATSVLITFGVPPAIASASIHTSEAVVDFASAVAHWRKGNVDLRISKTLLIPGIIASVLGAYVITRLELSTAKPLVRIALIILGLIILYQTHYGKT